MSISEIGTINEQTTGDGSDISGKTSRDAHHTDENKVEVCSVDADFHYAYHMPGTKKALPGVFVDN
jgi:hypothetical protein